MGFKILTLFWSITVHVKVRSNNYCHQYKHFYSIVKAKNFLTIDIDGTTITT